MDAHQVRLGWAARLKEQPPARMQLGSTCGSCLPRAKHPPFLPRACSNVRGCDCCLADTSTVSSCFAYSRSCGPDYCNCEGQEPGCVASQLLLEDLLYAWQGDPSCNISACGLDYFEQAANSPQAETAKSALKLECDGEECCRFRGRLLYSGRALPVFRLPRVL